MNKVTSFGNRGVGMVGQKNTPSILNHTAGQEIDLKTL